MKYFNCDYNEGAHESILNKMIETNMTQTPGYGEDEYCSRAAKLIQEACRADVDIHFMVGGTQTNLIVVSSFLRPHQGVIAADWGHINTHESGAIENTGHRVLALPSKEGKITAEQVARLCETHVQDENRVHTVQPKMVYLSVPTEWGTTYNRQELEELQKVCRQYGLLLYVDGARLAYALAEENSSVDIPLLAKCCDVFYIGGTKCGAMFGEALVLVNPQLRQDFRYLIKQKGAMLAKGRLLGIQFETLFTDGLYEKLGQHGVAMAEQIRTACKKAGYQFYIENGTNQIFPILPTQKLESLKKNYSFLDMGPEKAGYRTVRFCTSWATQKEDVDDLVRNLLK